MKIAVVFVGVLEDQGFNACARIGADRVDAQPEVALEVFSGVPFEPAAMEAALAAAAARNDGVIFVGGQGDRVTPKVAAAFPDRAFAVVQGEVTGPNLASYDVLQEQSAFLAGCLAARMTQTGVVGHLSGHRVAPGLKGRAAFVAGVGHVDAGVRVLTGFCGTQDDSAVTEAWAAAEIAAGADILFTMLNAARAGATAACRAGGARQIGNVLDWVARDPDVYLASAIARIDLGVERAAADMLAGHVPAVVQHLGLASAGAVALSMSRDIPFAVAAEIAAISSDLAGGILSCPASYGGAEFEP